MKAIAARCVGPIVARSKVGTRSDYRDYIEHLRWDFWFACGYCHLTECEAAGIAFQIDHYIPVSRDTALKAVYGNLMYACSECNVLKSDHPSEHLAALGYRFFRPDTDNPDDHFRANPTDELRVQGTTPKVGEYTEKMLRLNREALIRLRQIRSMFAESKVMMIQGTRVLRGLTVQEIPSAKRTLYMETRARLLDAGHAVNERLDETIVKEMNRSTLLDEEPKPRDAVERREYLARLNASVPPPAK